MNPLLATALAVGGFVLGAVFNALTGIADRVVGRRARKGDLAAVSLAYEHWKFGSVSVPPTPVSSHPFMTDEPAVLFPMTVTNGSEDKISNVEFGLRWHGDGERQAAHVPALKPGDFHTASAAEVIDEASFEPESFEEVWLSSLAFYVRFTDQRGGRWENLLDQETDPPWTSRRL